MASIWLDTIEHEMQQYHCDTIKLRRPMLVQQIRLASTQTPFSRLEFMAKNLRTPSDDPVLIKKIPKLQENSGMDVWPLSEPILTNHLVVKGDYKKLSLCLEANEAVLKQESIVIRPTEAEVQLLSRAPLPCNGLYQYWLDEDDRGPFLLSVPAQPPHPRSSPPFFPLWKGPFLQDLHSRAGEVASLCSLLMALDEEVPIATYFLSLEKLGDLVHATLAHFRQLPEDSFTGLDCSSQIYAAVPPATVALALKALDGTRQGLAEARSSLCLIGSILALPKLSAVYREHRGLHNLILLLTHPNEATTQLKLAVINTLDSLLVDPQATLSFLENKFSRDFRDGIVYEHLSVPRKTSEKPGKEPTKRPKQEEYTKPTVLETGYQIILGQLLQSPPAKLSNALRLFLGKCGFFLELSNLPRQINDPDPSRILKLLDSIRKKLKLHLLQSSSKSFQSVKHDLQSTILLDSCRTAGQLRSAVQLLGQPVLTRTLAAWLDSCDFLDCCIRLVVHKSVWQMSIQDYRSLLCNVAEILVALLRSRGGSEYFATHSDQVKILSQVLADVKIQDCQEDADLALLEEENLLSIMQMEKLPSYAHQLSRLLTALLDLGSLLNDFFRPGNRTQAAANLYGFLNSPEQKTLGLFYHYMRLHPDVLLAMVELCSLSNPEGVLLTFYVLEFLQNVLYEDRAAEIFMMIGASLHTFLKSLPKYEAPSDMQTTIEVLLQLLEPSARLETSGSLLEDLLHYVSHNARLEPVTDLKIVDLVEPIQSLSKLSRTPAPKVSLSTYGLLTEPNSAILKLLPAIRVLSAVIALNKWSTAILIERSFLRTLSGIIYQVTSILQALYLQTMAEVVFNVQDKSQQKREHFEVLVPALNIFNMYLHQLLATDLQCYNDPVLFETLVALNAICEISLVMNIDLTIKKVQKLVTTTFILWAQFPLFAEEYLVQLLEQALHYPYKHAPTLNLASSIFEHFVSYKNPGFIQKYVSLLTKSPSPMVFSPCLLHFHMLQAKSTEDQAALYDLYVSQWDRIKDIKPSKLVPRMVWETRRQFAILSESDLSVLERFIDSFVLTNNHDLQQALVRLLRCVVATNHEEACYVVIRKLLAMLRDSSAPSKVLQTIYGIIDVPAAKSLMIYEDLPEDLIRMLESKELRLMALRILRVLFDVKIGICSEELSRLKTSEEPSATQQQSTSLGRYKLVEDMPTVSHTQQFLAECKRFLTFKLPEGVALEGDVGMDDYDPLYDEFTKRRSECEDQNSEQCTLLVYRILWELCQHPLGKTLLLCGEFPPKEQNPIIDFVDTLRYVTSIIKSCHEVEWTCKMLGLTDLILNILKETGSRLCPRESLISLQRELVNGDLPRASYYLTLMAQIPESVENSVNFDLPHPRGLTERFAALLSESRKLTDFQDKIRRAQREHLVLNERLGERVQVKAIHSLTDLIPPPYPPLFRYRSDVDESEWKLIKSAPVEFVPEVTTNVQKESEDREKKQAKLPVYPQPPVMPPMPMPMNPMYPGMMPQMMPPGMQPQIVRPPGMPMHGEEFMAQRMMPPPPPILPPSSFFSPEDHKAIEEIKRLLNLQNERADPRIQSKIAQILSEHPNVQPYIQSKTD